MICAPDLRLDWSFPREYDVMYPARLGDPGKLPQIYYPGASRTAGSASLMVRVIPKTRAPWVAAFQGDAGPHAAIFSTPNARKFCALVYGAAYFVNAEEPQDWFAVEAVCPVLSAHAVLQENFLLFADNIHLAAYGASGPIWVSERVCCDWLRISEFTDDTVKGTGFDAPADNEHAEFAVELKTGRILYGPY